MDSSAAAWCDRFRLSSFERDRLGARTQEELAMSNNFQSHFSTDDAALVLIDFQQADRRGPHLA
jgi:hypothetical protein